MRHRFQVQIVLVAPVRPDRKTAGEVERPLRLPAGDDAAAEVEQRPRSGAPQGGRRPGRLD
jgi:hypothetical protein